MTIKIVFPFTIQGMRPEVSMASAVERKEDLVSFSLEYSLDLAVENAELMSREESNGLVIYVYKFADLNAAMSFMNTRTVHGVQSRETPDVDRIEQEMDAFMKRYEAGEKTFSRAKKKAVVTGEDGFMKYV